MPLAKSCHPPAIRSVCSLWFALIIGAMKSKDKRHYNDHGQGNQRPWQEPSGHFTLAVISHIASGACPGLLWRTCRFIGFVSHNLPFLGVQKTINRQNLPDA